MIWIEIIGASGVGKSYWYENFMQKYPDYEPKQLVLNQIYKSEDLTKVSLKIKFMFWGYFMKLYSVSTYFKQKLFRYFLKDFQRKSKAVFTPEDDLMIRKFLKNIDTLHEPQIFVLKKIEYFYRKLIEFKFYQFYLEENEIYLAEDGILHLSPIFIEELQADRVLIFEKEYEKIVAQRSKRAQEPIPPLIVTLFDENDLKSHIQDYYQRYAEKIKLINDMVPSSKVKTIELDKEEVVKEMYHVITEAKRKL